MTSQANPFQYLINGVSKPVIQLHAGNTYTFQLENVASNHPFIITTSTTGGSASVEHTTGVTGNNVVGMAKKYTYSHSLGNGVLTFAVNSSTPNNLYFQCKIHSNMGAAILINTNPVPACTPSPSTFCVSSAANPFQYFINGISRANVTMKAGASYNFQMLNVPSVHPLILTTSATGGPSSVEYTDGVTNGGVSGMFIINRIN